MLTTASITFFPIFHLMAFDRYAKLVLNTIPNRQIICGFRNHRPAALGAELLSKSPIDIPEIDFAEGGPFIIVPINSLIYKPPVSCS